MGYCKLFGVVCVKCLHWKRLDDTCWWTEVLDKRSNETGEFVGFRRSWCDASAPVRKLILATIDSVVADSFVVVNVPALKNRRQNRKYCKAVAYYSLRKWWVQISVKCVYSCSLNFRTSCYLTTCMPQPGHWIFLDKLFSR